MTITEVQGEYVNAHWPPDRVRLLRNQGRNRLMSAMRAAARTIHSPMVMYRTSRKPRLRRRTLRILLLLCLCAAPIFSGHISTSVYSQYAENGSATGQKRRICYC